MVKQLDGIKMLEFDGCSEIWVEKWDDWMTFFGSDEYAKAMGPDCKYFMQMPISVYVGRRMWFLGGRWRVWERGERMGFGEDVKGYE